MNWRAIRTIMWRDLKVVVRSKAVLLPLIIVPLIFLVIIPGAGGIALASSVNNEAAIADIHQEFDTFLQNLPESIQHEIDQFDTELQGITYLVFVYFLAPFFLILPTMVANVIAADSFVGEKERKTLEALLYTPTTERELYTAKLLAPWAAAVFVAVGGFIAYSIIVNIVSYPVMHRIYFPNLTWFFLALWVSPAAAGVGLGGIVLVSSRVKTFQEASQLGGVIVLPIVMLVLGQVAGVLYFNLSLVIVLGLVLWLIDLGIFWYGANSFSRSELISRV